VLLVWAGSLARPQLFEDKKEAEKEKEKERTGKG